MDIFFYSSLIEKANISWKLIYKYNLAFSNVDTDLDSNTESEIFGNKTIILKKVKSLRQLRRGEKELVRLCYKEAIIKGFTLKGIQQYGI